MQQHNVQRTIARLVGAAVLFLSSVAGQQTHAGCQGPEQLASVVPKLEIQRATILAGIVTFGETTGICLGIELADDQLTRQPMRLDFSGVHFDAALRNALEHVRGYSVAVSGAVVVVQPDRERKQTWLDMKIPRFTVQRASLQAASNVLFMYLRQQALPQEGGGFAGHFRTGEIRDMVGPFDERDRTVRELLNILVGSSSGALWITTEPPNGTTIADRPFWTILEYSDQTVRSAGSVDDLVRRTGEAFSPRSSADR